VPVTGPISSTTPSTTGAPGQAVAAEVEPVSTQSSALEL
jgi:hypothetical protein